MLMFIFFYLLFLLFVERRLNWSGLWLTYFGSSSLFGRGLISNIIVTGCPHDNGKSKLIDVQLGTLLRFLDFLVHIRIIPDLGGARQYP